MQKELLPLIEAVQSLDIRSRVTWCKRLAKYDIVIIKQGTTEYISSADFCRLKEMQEAYEPLEAVCAKNGLALSPDKFVQAAKLLAELGLVIKSDELPCTDQIRQYMSKKPHAETIRAIQLFCSTTGPEVDHGVTVGQLAKMTHTKERSIICDLYHEKIRPCHLFYIQGFLYIHPDYADQCVKYHKDRISLNELLSGHRISPEMVFRKVNQEFASGLYDQYYVGSEEGWYGLRRDRNKIKKRIPVYLEEFALEQGGLPEMDLDGIPYVDAAAYAEQICHDSAFMRSNSICRKAYERFLMQNQKMLEIRRQNGACMIPAKRTKQQEKMLALYLESYSRSPEEIYKSLKERLTASMPTAMKLLDMQQPSVLVANGVMMQLLVHAKHDLPDYSQTELNRLTEVFQKAPLVDGKCFEKMVRQAYQNYPCSFRSLPKFKSAARSQVSHEKTAYSFEQFANMAYCLFNPDYAKRENLMQKACEISYMAETWLFLCLHWICALRPSDLQRLPILALPEEPNRIVEQLRQGVLPDDLCEKTIDALAFQIQMNPWKPQKTQKYQVPSIKLFFPQSLKVHFGRLYLLVLSHREIEGRQDASLFRLPSTQGLKKFLGDHFMQQLENGSFSSRSANKAFLQGIQEITDRESREVKIDGYIMASLARSHKINDHELAEVTEIYLRDAKFTGRTPEYFAQIMFDRGILSFIPDLMLKILYGDSYRALSTEAQTAMIQSVNLSPLEIESIMIASASTLQTAQADVIRLLQSKSKEDIVDGLCAIVHGQAASKGMHSYCLRRAMHQTCDHAVCIGCPYEMQTRADVYLLVQQYQEMMQRYRKACKEQRPAEEERYRELIRHLITMISSAAAYLQEHDPSSPMLAWMMEVIQSC